MILRKTITQYKGDSLRLSFVTACGSLEIFSPHPPQPYTCTNPQAKFPPQPYTIPEAPKSGNPKFPFPQFRHASVHGAILIPGILPRPNPPPILIPEGSKLVKKGLSPLSPSLLTSYPFRQIRSEQPHLKAQVSLRQPTPSRPLWASCCHP